MGDRHSLQVSSPVNLAELNSLGASLVLKGSLVPVWAGIFIRTFSIDFQFVWRLKLVSSDLPLFYCELLRVIDSSAPRRDNFLLEV